MVMFGATEEQTRAKWKARYRINNLTLYVKVDFLRHGWHDSIDSDTKISRHLISPDVCES